uniref:Uncharacterized protein n=1 Tax=Rhipicephalus zambeziensis TaxID=60191 RepID=A0A224Y4W5_9ACAR
MAEEWRGICRCVSQCRFVSRVALPAPHKIAQTYVIWYVSISVHGNMTVATLVSSITQFVLIKLFLETICSQIHDVGKVQIQTRPDKLCWDGTNNYLCHEYASILERLPWGRCGRSQVPTPQIGEDEEMSTVGMCNTTLLHIAMPDCLPFFFIGAYVKHISNTISTQYQPNAGIPISYVAITPLLFIAKNAF